MITYILPDREPVTAETMAPDIGDRIRVDGKLYRVDEVDVTGPPDEQRYVHTATVRCSKVG